MKPCYQYFSNLFIVGMLCCLSGQAAAGSYSLANAPISPTSYEECQAVNDSNLKTCFQISKDWNRCIDYWGFATTRANKNCEPLIVERERCSQHHSEQIKLCSDRLGAYKNQQNELLKQQEQQERQARDAENNRRQQARESENSRQQQLKDASAYERARSQETQRAAAIRDSNQRSRQQQYEAKAQAVLAVGNLLGSLFSSKSSRSSDDSASERAQARAEQERSATREREEAAQRESTAQKERVEASKREREAQVEREKRTKEENQSAYDQLKQKLVEMKEVGIGARIALSNNPFDTTVKLGAREMNNGLLDAGLDAALPLGSAKNDSDYNTAASALSVVQSIAMRPNPFAKEVSKVAMHGVNNINRRVLGEMDTATQGINSILSEGGGTSTGSGPLLHSTPAPSGSGGAGYPGSDSLSTSTSTTYYDQDTRQTLVVPSGHVLYRSPETNQLIAVNSAQIPELMASGDRPGLGDKGCRVTGVGIVVCEKEQQAKANPFRNR